MSYNLCKLPKAEQQALEAEKQRLFRLWKLNNPNVKKSRPVVTHRAPAKPQLDLNTSLSKQQLSEIDQICKQKLNMFGSYQITAGDLRQWFGNQPSGWRQSRRERFNARIKSIQQKTTKPPTKSEQRDMSLWRNDRTKQGRG